MGDMSEGAAAPVDICAADDVWEGAGKRVTVAGFPPLAVFNLEGDFFVIADTCTHGDASLADGYVENGEVECPYHSGRFCIRTGEPRSEPVETPVKVYPARVVQGRVCIERQGVCP
jgi:nitrite reductase/ring-hydroxylating ferredoxin subunit